MIFKSLLPKLLTLTLLLYAPAAVADDGPVIFDFPPGEPLAELIFPTQFKDLKGVKRIRKERVLARGKFALPREARVEIYLKPSGLEHMDLVEKLKATNVVILDVHNMDFDDTHMPHIRDFKNVFFLNLYGTCITDKSLPLVGKFQEVTMLKLSRTGINGKNLDQICHLKKLTHLFCGNVALERGAAMRLKPIVPNLQRLDLGRTSLKKEDAAVVQYATNALVLDLSCNTDVDNSVVKKMTNLKKLKTLYIADTRINDRALPDLLKLPALERIFVRERTFWVTGPAAQKALSPANRAKIIDIADHSDTPLETFSPLH